MGHYPGKSTNNPSPEVIFQANNLIMGSKIQNVIVETDNDAIFSIRCCFNFSLNYKPEEPVLNSIEKNTLLIILIMSTEAWTYINVLELIKLILIKYC